MFAQAWGVFAYSFNSSLSEKCMVPHSLADSSKGKTLNISTALQIDKEQFVLNYIVI